MTRHRIIFKTILEMTRSTELTMGVVKSVRCIIVSIKGVMIAYSQHDSLAYALLFLRSSLEITSQYESTTLTSWAVGV